MKRTALFSVVLLLTFACGGGEKGPASAEGPSSNPVTKPVDTLELAWEVGEELGDSTRSFGGIAAAAIDSQGRLFVLDQVAACVKVFDLQGRYIRQVSRRGSGPGELRMPMDLFTMPGRLMVHAPMKKGYVAFGDSLELADEYSLWSMNPPIYCVGLSDSQYVGYKIGQEETDDGFVMRRSIAIYTLGEEDWDTRLWVDSMSATIGEMMEDPSMFLTDLMDPLALGGTPERGVYFALKDPESYSVTGWDSTGTEILSISQDLHPVAKSAAEMEAESLYMNRYLQNMARGGGGFPFEYEPRPYRPMITALGIGPDGNLWVRRGTRNEPFFDIYDLQGNLLRHAVFPDDGWSWQTEVTPQGIIAWEDDPEEGYQRLYLLQ